MNNNLINMKQNLLIALILVLTMGATKAQVDFIWGKQFGTSKDEKARNIISDTKGNVYIFGKTKGDLGEPNLGNDDGFVVKVDSTANIVWRVQVGSTEDDDIKQAVADNFGNVYITGQIGISERDALVKQNDILVVKIDSLGNIVWQKQFGTDSTDIGRNIIVDSKGDLYVIGDTWGAMGKESKGKADCFILHLDNNGIQLEVMQFGTSGDDGIWGIDIGNDSRLYVCGFTQGNLVKEKSGDSDAFWGVFSKDLNLLKLRQFGTNNYDFALGIKTDSKNNIYIAGNTGGDLASTHKGAGDCFLLKINNNEEILWTKQFGTPNWDGINGLDLFQDDKVIISGCMNYPSCQSFCRMYDENGELLWKRKYVASGEGGGTCGKGISIDSRGYIYHGGYTGGNLFSKLWGKHDIFLIRLNFNDGK
jgi:hypothetical protein